MWYSLQVANFDKANGRVIGNQIFKEASTLSEAIAEARHELTLKGFTVSIAGRKVAGQEWDCDSWTISGHKQHGKAH